MKKYDEIVEILKVPKIVIPFLNIIYTDDDLEILAAIKDATLTKSSIETLMGRNSQEILKSAYKDSVVDKVLSNGEIEYKASALTVRLDNLASFQRERWHQIQSEHRKKIADWLYKDYLDAKKNKSVKELVDCASKIVPLDVAIDFVKTEKKDIYVIPCDCKSIEEGCDFDKNVCMSMGSGLNTSSDRGHGKKLNTQEAVELLKHADKEGLIHSLEENAICNCCSCCCYPLRASKELGLKGKWPAVSYVINLDRESCIGCGICTGRCPQKVFEKQGKTIKIDISKCVGCGVCVSTCPKKALHLQQI
ncbi:4Fe-4S binding protein [Clostridium akagii]|uniref:4Fe-4S binding protein n=1 Tax=Clostridium akagii TaxID=91623 RepID=UPI00047AE1C0|nr:4Fe-4S binding protein [Clostridium akagii]